MDKIVELQIFLTLRKLFQNFEQYGFGLKKKLDFVMDKLNLANLLGKVMNKIMEYQIFCQSAQEDKSLEFMANYEISPA